ncbi:MAG: biotin-dependent carboxyltransferase family protein [Ferruginibacter sp.]
MSIKIIKPGICSTIQDLGRTGFRSLGIGPGGAMDFFAAAVANYLVGNIEKQPVIEIHFPAAEILFQSNTLISISGGDFDAHINETSIEINQPCFIQAGDVLSFKKNISGVRIYLAINGGMEAENWLGSASTNIKVKAGGFKGRLLQKEDTIKIHSVTVEKDNRKIAVSSNAIHSVYNNQNTILCIAGPDWHLINASSENIFLTSAFTITNQSDRMGYRMAGESLSVKKTTELISSPVVFGIIQLLPNGQLIILMADHQTTGGYPRIATVIAADLPKLAQLPVNAKINFKLVSPGEAEERLISLHKTLTEIQAGCQNFYDKY